MSDKPTAKQMVYGAAAGGVSLARLWPFILQAASHDSPHDSKL